VAIPLKTARLTVLLDPIRKQAFERACRDDDMTPSQVLRNLIRDFVAARAGGAAVAKPARKRMPAVELALAPAKRANARRG
jgi:hypothetical protein